MFSPATKVAMSAASLMLLSACSGDDPSSIQPAASASPTPSDIADEQAVVQLADDLWTAREEAGRESDPARETFASILSPSLLERELTELSRYEELGVTREGSPVVTDIEAQVDGDSATALMCLNEDSWVAYEKGRKIEGEDFGVGPYGFTAERTDGQWKVASFLDGDVTSKDKPC